MNALTNGQIGEVASGHSRDHIAGSRPGRKHVARDRDPAFAALRRETAAAAISRRSAHPLKTTIGLPRKRNVGAYAGNSIGEEGSVQMRIRHLARACLAALMVVAVVVLALPACARQRARGVPSHDRQEPVGSADGWRTRRTGDEFQDPRPADPRDRLRLERQGQPRRGRRGVREPPDRRRPRISGR
jgi:hypothetical protein